MTAYCMTPPDDTPAAPKRAPWFVSLLSFYVQRVLLRRKLPLLASFKLTYRCNLACSACPFHHRAAEPGSHMSWETAVRCLQEVHGRGCRLVVFEGGEPFLWQDGRHGLADLVCLAKSMFLRVAVTTNGTLPLDIPADVIWVSIDGLQETHDMLRSRSFDRAWGTLRNSQHPKLLVHVTINRANWRELEPLMKKLRELPAVKGVTVQIFYPYAQGEEPLGLSPQERRAALESAMELKRRGYPILNSRSRLKAMIENRWTCHDDVLVNVDPDGTITSGCYVKSRGKIHCESCGFTPVAEASGALQLRPGPILAGWRIYLRR